MADINILAPFIFSFEGNFANIPQDKGGPTNKGVTINTWKAYGYDKNGDGVIDIEDIKLITNEDATIIMKKFFWDLYKADYINDQSVANILVDWLWMSGKPAITLTQKLVGVTADGIVGPKTLHAINSRNPQKLFDAIKKRRIVFYDTICRNRPANNMFKKGWLRRLDHIKYGSLTYADNKTKIAF